MKESLAIVPEFFFDICGIFIPGMALLSAICWMFMPFVGLPDNAYKAIAVILLAYLLGHMLFALSQRCVAWLASKLSGNPKREWLEASSPLGSHLRGKIVDRAGEKWCLSADCIEDKRMIYELCRNYTHARNSELSSFLRKEQTYGELSRSMVIAFLLCAVLIWFSQKSLEVTLLTFSVCLVSTFLFYARYLKAREADACLVYTNFIVLLEEENENKEARAKSSIKAA